MGKTLLVLLFLALLLSVYLLLKSLFDIALWILIGRKPLWLTKTVLTESQIAEIILTTLQANPQLSDHSTLDEVIVALNVYMTTKGYSQDAKDTVVGWLYSRALAKLKQGDD